MKKTALASAILLALGAGLMATESAIAGFCLPGSSECGGDTGGGGGGGGATDDELQAKYDEGYADGHAAGLEEGHVAGYEEGYAKGNEEGHAAGYEEGYAKGYEDGYKVGYAEGYAQGQKDCRDIPGNPCNVLLEDAVGDPGYGETEPNDHIMNADGMVAGQFYHGNSFDETDEDWYSVVTDTANTTLTLNFIGDSSDYTNTEGWIVKVRDLNGNVVAAFQTKTTGTAGAEPTVPDDGEATTLFVPRDPLSNAKVAKATLGNAGTYYVSVKPFLKSVTGGDPTADGTWRDYSIAAILTHSGQTSPNPDTNYFDTETEVNDTQGTADLLRSNIHMFGSFGREIVKTQADAIVFKDTGLNASPKGYTGCNKTNSSTFPPGYHSCVCNLDTIAKDTGGTYPFQLSKDMCFTNDPDADPVVYEFYSSGLTPSPAGYTGCNLANPATYPLEGEDCSCKISEVSLLTGGHYPYIPSKDMCVAIPGGTWVGGFDYDEDWYQFTSIGNEQLWVDVCAKGECQFTVAHLDVVRQSDGAVLFNGPVKPGQTLYIGVTSEATYYFGFSAEPTDGPEVDAQTGQHTVVDLVGPYNFMLRSTKMTPGG